MANYKVTDTELTSIANAIRTKGGTSAQLEFPTEFVSAIAAIPTGGGGGLVPETPLEVMHTESYINQGTWYTNGGGAGNNLIELYSVDPTHKYLYMLGENKDIAKLVLSDCDPRTVTTNTRSMSNVVNASSPQKRQSFNVEPYDNYLTYFVAQIADDAEHANLRGYLFDVTGLTGLSS